MDNVGSELGIHWTNRWITGHLVWPFTDLFRETLIFYYLIIMGDNINVSERKEKTNTKQDKLAVEKFLVDANVHDVIKPCHDHK